jgi:hypothetical protein
MDKPKPLVPILATVCGALLSIAALIAVLTHHPVFTFYCGLGFLAVFAFVWLRSRRQNIQR